MKVSRSPVVMIHGAFCGGWVFEHWRAAFEAQGYRGPHADFALS